MPEEPKRQGKPSEEDESKIDEAGKESFPASDAPSYNAGKKDDADKKKDVREPNE